MSDFAVTVPGVEQTAVATRSAGADLRSELARLRRDVDSVLCDRWRGVAASAFDRAWGEWHSGALEVICALERLAELLVDSAREYQASVDSAASRLHIVSAALPGS